MNNPMGMGLGEGLKNLACNSERRDLTQTPLIHQIAERAAMDVIHHDEESAVFQSSTIDE